MPSREDLWRLGAGLGSLAGVTFVYLRWLNVTNPTTVSFTYLMVVLGVAATARVWAAVATSFVAVLCFNFFFLPPVGTFTIADPHNWVALLAFLSVSLVASNLSAVARARTEEALARQDELARLFDLGRDVLGLTERPEALGALARAVSRRFDLSLVAIALPREGTWDVFYGGPQRVALDPAQLSAAFAEATTTLEFDAYQRTYAGHRILTVDGAATRLVPLRAGTKPIGVLAAAGRAIEPGTIDALGGVVAMAIERAHLLDERKTAELTRQSEELKTALLASLGHDLRTPLTAIRVAASNLATSALSPEERAEQTDVILAEVERLRRMFESILEMARIDAGAVAADARWVPVSEIVAAAVEQVEQTLRRHHIQVEGNQELIVRLDPRLTANALAHLLENAGHYAPVGTMVHVDVVAADEGLSIRVRDHGPGITPEDQAHLFERFYRGTAAGKRASGTGMGLWIARGLLAVQRGRIWAENCADGGAQFTLLVPAPIREPSSSP
jgi:two-component system sensor histidine kinase KdpD